jgi:drug/metabolite transporter (DMT)-like permease
LDLWDVSVDGEEGGLVDSAVSLALCAAFFFGLALVFAQFGLRSISPSHGALLTLPSMTVLLWALAPMYLDWRAAKLAGVEFFAVAGVLTPGLVTVLTHMANRRMGPAIAGALGNLAPLFAVPVAVILLGEIPDSRQALGMVIIVVGVALLSLTRTSLGKSWPFWAMGLPISAAAIRGLSQSVIKMGLTEWPSPFGALLIGYTVSSVVVTVSILLRRDWPSGLHREGILWFGGVAFANGAAMTTLYQALDNGPVILVAPLVATYPLVTLLLSAIIFRSAQFSLRLIIGVLLTVVGVTMLIGF